MKLSSRFGHLVASFWIGMVVLLFAGCKKPDDAAPPPKQAVSDKPGGPAAEKKEPGKAKVEQPPDPLAEAKQRSKANLKRIAEAFEKYETANGHYPIGLIDPKSGIYVLSWRVQILPYLDDPEAAKTFKQFRLDEPWDSEHNKKLLAAMPKVYAPVRGDTEAGRTFYQGFADHFLDPSGKEWPESLPILAGTPGAFFPDPRSPAFEMATPNAGVPDRSRKIIPDGTLHTFLVAEAGDAVPWTKPQDIPFRRKSDKTLAGVCPKLGGLFGGDFHVVTVSGAVYYVKKEVPPMKLAPFITFAGAEDLDYFGIGLEPPDWADVKPFIGAWVRTSFEENGKKQALDASKKHTLKFTKDNKVVYAENETIKMQGQFHVFDKKEVRWDWKGDVQDRVLYKFDGNDKLTTCWTRTDGKPAPARFETGVPGGGASLAVWRRVP
jgi:uncharacterized protein (TIGR03067 family)